MGNHDVCVRYEPHRHAVKSQLHAWTGRQNTSTSPSITNSVLLCLDRTKKCGVWRSQQEYITTAITTSIIHSATHLEMREALHAAGRQPQVLQFGQARVGATAQVGEPQVQLLQAAGQHVQGHL